MTSSTAGARTAGRRQVVSQSLKRMASLALVRNLKLRARALKREVRTLYFAAQDPRTPWYAKALLACVVAYALSPIDLIPDPIPILGYLDDLLLLPLGIYLSLKLVPQSVLEESRHKAAIAPPSPRRSLVAAALIILFWMIAGSWICVYLWQRWSG